MKTFKTTLSILLSLLSLAFLLLIIETAKLNYSEAQEVSKETVYYQTMGFTLLMFACMAGALSLAKK